MKRSLVVLLVFLTPFLGCASGSKIILLDGISPGGAPVCFEDPKQIPVFFEHYYSVRDLSTEEGKIEYLLERVSRSGYTFVRNGVEFGSQASAQFLRWKMDRLKSQHSIKVETAEEFVQVIAGGSRVTGRPYAVRIPEEGGDHDLQKVLANELDVLGACLNDMNTESQGEGTQDQDTHIEEKLEHSEVVEGFVDGSTMSEARVAAAAF